MLNMDQTQRRDIDITLDDRLTLSIDEENLADNPYPFEPTSFVGNNWFKQGNNIVKLNIAEQDSIVFLSAPLSKLSQKDITNIIVSFDYNISNVSVNYPILSNCSLTCMDMTNYFLVENILTTQGHIDVDCSLFNFSSNVVNTAISEQGFKVGINFNGNKSNATVKLSNVVIKFKYNNKLESQSDSVINRIEPHIDFWREDDDLVLQIGGDASGKGIDHSGGDVDTYSKAEIDAKLELKVNAETGKGLSSNDYTLTEKTKLSTVENNANYYVHPSNHNSSIIVESSALENLETSANATQHEINLAIDDKINQGGGGSVDIVTAWESTPSDSKVASEKLVKDSLDGKLDNAISSTVVSVASNDDILITDYSDSNKVKRVANILATQVKDSNSYSNIGSSANATQGTINSNIDTALSNKANSSSLSAVATSGSYADLSNKPTIPTKISDLTNDSDFIEKSNTSGLVKNDGTIDTTTYLTSSALSNYVQKSSTNGLLKNDGTVDTSSYITSSALSNYVQKSNTTGLLKNDGTVDTTSYSTFSGSYNDLSNKPTIPTKISDLTNDSDFIEKSNTSGLVKNDGTIDTTTYLSSLPSHNHDDRYYTESEVDTALNGKQATLVSGTNIKTIINNSLLGSGNIAITTDDITDPSAYSTIGTSTNATQSAINSAMDTALADKISKSSTVGLVLNDGSVDSDLYSLLKSIECSLLLDDDDCGMYLKRDDLG